MSTAKQSSKDALWPAYLAATGTLVLWSGTAIANKFAVMHMDALSAGVLRSMIAGLLALLVALAMKLPFPRSTGDRVLLLISGITSFAFWPMLLSLGIGRTTAGHAALIMAMIPVFTVLIAAVLARRLPRLMWWVGAGIALVATSILVNSQAADQGGSSRWGDLVVLSGCICCASGYVAGGRLSPRIGTAATTFWGLTVALIVLLPAMAFLHGRTEWSTLPDSAWMGIAWMALLSSFTGYALWFFALGRAGIEKISTLQLLMPVLTLAVAAVLLSEQLNWVIAGVCIAIVAGTGLAQRYAR